MKEKKHKRKILLLLFPILFILLSTILNPSSVNPNIGIMLGIAIWMLGWWITEVVPIGATSLLPIVLFPLTGIISGEEISNVYFNEVIFLYIGGFMLALAIEKWEVHKRIAAHTLMIFGKSSLPLKVSYLR